MQKRVHETLVDGYAFIMSYGGCEVIAIPSLIFGQRYVVYCPWNAVDLVDKVIADHK